MDYNWDIGGNKSPVTNHLSNPMAHLGRRSGMIWEVLFLYDLGTEKSDDIESINLELFTPESQHISPLEVLSNINPILANKINQYSPHSISQIMSYKTIVSKI